MRLRFTIAAIAIVLLLGTSIFFLYQWIHRNNAQEMSRVLPDLVFQDYSGNNVSLSNFEGKAIVISLWTSWCPFCDRELQYLSMIQKEMGDSIHIVAINRAESLDIAKKYSDAAIKNDSLIFLRDPSDSLYSALQGFSVPETLFIDKNGAVRAYTHGLLQPEEIRRDIQDIL